MLSIGRYILNCVYNTGSEINGFIPDFQIFVTKLHRILLIPISIELYFSALNFML